MKKNYTFVLGLLIFCFKSLTAQVVINEVYGGGGNSGAPYQNDFVELYNNSGTDITLSNWSIQYTSAGGTSWGNNKVIFSGTILKDGYFLIKLSGGATGSPLPPEDALGAINMSATSGKIVLCNNSENVTSVANPTDIHIVDKVGYGSLATGFEGSGPAPDASNTTSIQRIAPGVDNNDNNMDFTADVPSPTNSFPSLDITPPSIISLSPSNNATDVYLTSLFTISFSEFVQKGTGNIYVKNFSDNSIVHTIDVTSSSVTVINASVTFIISSLQTNSVYYIEIDNRTFKDLANNDFIGLGGNSSWKFTTTGALYAYDFSTCTGSLPNDGFSQYSVNGAQIWACTSFGRDPNNLPLGNAPGGVQINGYDNVAVSNVPNEDWLISPSFDLTSTAFPLLSFWSRTKFNGVPLQLKVSTDYPGFGDPRNYNWTDLNGRFPGQTTDRWIQSININLSAFKQSPVYIAFVYLSSNEEGARWTLDDIRIDNSLTAPPSTLTINITDMQFDYTAAGSTTDKTFSLTSNDITADIIIDATENFLLSKDGTTFTSSIIYTLSEANNITNTVYVRFAPARNDQNFNGTTTINTLGLSSVISLKGSSIDVAKTLEVVNWNVEWFGSTSFGPPNKDRQEQNVRTILQNMGADLYGLVEVVDTARLGNVVRQMPGYAYIVGNFGSHVNPYVTSPIPISEAQKLAFVYKTSVFSNIDTTTLLSRGVNTPEDLNNPSYNYWASGRYPFMMSADVTLDGVSRNIKFILVHAKANTSPTITSYNRRKAGADELHTLLNANYSSDNIVILGDFNDDLDQTITDGVNPPTTSYISFTGDNVNFSPITLELSNAGKTSTISYNDVIDHVVVSNEMKAYYMNSTANILNDVSTLVSGYGTTTSDHYPVFSRFAFDASLLPVKLASFDGEQQTDKILLNWISKNEVNSKEFIIERSKDGRSFTPISSLPSVGNSNTAFNYSYIDHYPLDGNNFYRLKQIDKDSKWEYSKVIRVYFKTQLQIILQPNPATKFVEVLFHGTNNASATIRLTDLNGRIVKQQVEKPVGHHPLRIDVSALHKGLYIITIILGDKIKTSKLVIK